MKVILVYRSASYDASDQSSDFFLRSKDICSVVIREHQQRIRPLPIELYKKFIHLLRERVNLHRSHGRWLEAIYWCDVMLSFVETTDQSNWVICSNKIVTTVSRLQL